jgi:alpha-glucosidase (family GH31 glycosyl hydrolase)
MRPLFMEFPKDEKVFKITTEFMFGPSILVAPKLRERDSREHMFTVALHLPPGGWYNYSDN